MRIPPQASLVGLGLLAAACRVPGLYPEGRDLWHTGSVPAERVAVFDRSLRWFGPHGYTIGDSDRPRRIRAERVIDASRINVMDMQFTEEGARSTRLEIHVWTDLVSGGSRRKAPQRDPSVPHEMDAFLSSLSCAHARWPGCP